MTFKTRKEQQEALRINDALLRHSTDDESFRLYDRQN